jgi:hypothetical protein
MSATAESDDWADQYENAEYAQERYDETKEREEQREEQTHEAWGLKEQLQQARSDHTFTVEMYGIEIPFNPLPRNAESAIKEKRERMSICLEKDDFEGFVEQADHIAENASKWLATAYDGDESMTRPEDWEEIYSETERVELVTKVDQRASGDEMDAVLSFLGQG